MHKKLYISFLIFIYFIFASYFCFSQYEFIENKGQWHENVSFKMPLNNAAIFLESNSIRYAFVSSIDLHNSPTHHESEYAPKDLLKNAHAYKVNFVNSNPKPIISAEIKSLDYCNYYIGNDQSKWASNVEKYSIVKYIDIYNKIDMEYLANSDKLKYNFIIHKGGNPNNIELEYEGINKIDIINENVVIQTSVNTIKELRPYAFQIINGDTVSVNCSYILKRNRLKFDVEKYDKNHTLIIDPYLVFSSYSGSVGDNWGFTSTWDYDDNVFSGGVVFDIGFPVSLGAYQIDFAGGTPPKPGNSSYSNGCDIGIIKFNNDGTQRLYATYLGGRAGQEMPHSLVVTEKNELLIMGTTGSNDFPTSANAFQTNFAGGEKVVYDNVIGFENGVDIFVSKFSSDGKQLLASTFVGGTKNDGLNFKEYYNIPSANNVNHVLHFGNDSIYSNYADGARGEIVVDSKSYVYVGTNTFSGDFPTGINPGYQENSAGKQEGIVFKMNPDLSQMVWSSYLGGKEDDAIFSIALSQDEKVLVAGTTVSTDYPTTAGAFNTTFNGGNTDGFVSVLNNNGNQLLASSYFGSDKFDNINFVRSDKNNNIFICGQTRAKGMTLVRNANYFVANSGQFIAKFNPSLKELVWSTVFGNGNGRPNISITAFAVDVCNRVYLTGWGREWTSSYYNAEAQFYTWDTPDLGTKGMQVTDDAIQSETDGQDFYILVLKEDASDLEYASFFGELHNASCAASGRDHVDGGTSRFDNKGSIIQSVCASCGGCQDFPTFPDNVWSSSNMSTNCNNAVFKIKIIENLANANFDPIPIGCIPYTVDFHNTSQADSYSWDFGDGTTSTEENPSHTYNVGGQYLVTLVAYQPLTCNLYDTISRLIIVVEPGEKYLPDIEICKNQSVIIGPDNDYPEESVYTWVGEGLNNPNIKNPVASPSETTDYVLTVIGVCDDILHHKVIVRNPNLELTVSPDLTICEGESATLNASVVGDYVDEWQWSTDPNFNNIISNEQTIVVNPSVTTIYYVKAKENICNISKIEQVKVSIYEFNYDLAPNFIICPGETTYLNIVNNNPSDNLSFQWSPVSEIISGENTDSPLVGPSVTTTYYVSITSDLGCKTKDQTEVIVDILSVSASEVIHNLCYGDCLGEISVVAQGQAPYTYEWSNGDVADHITNLCAGTYELSVTDNSECKVKISVTVNQPEQLQVQFTDIVQPQCDGISFGKAKAVVLGGVKPYKYLWAYGGGNQDTNNSCLPGINYVTITDANDCQIIGEITMLAPSDFSIILTSEMTTCYGVCDGNASVQLVNGVAPFQVVWSTGESQESISNLCAGNYTLSVKDADNCVSHKHFEISEPSKLIVDLFVKEEVLCFGGTGSIGSNVSGGTSPYIYLWSNGDTSEEILNINSEVYSLKVTDYNNCTETSNIELSQPDALKMSSLVQNMLCTGVCNGKIFPNVSGGTGEYTYLWDNGSNSESIENLCSGEYSLTVKDENNCKIEQQFSVINSEHIPDLKVHSSSYNVYTGESFNLFAISSQNGVYLWDNEAFLNNPIIPNPIASIYDNITFHVVFKDEYGCVARDSVTIFLKEIVCGNPYIFVPNAFTPNNDDNNDYFKPYFPRNLITDVYFAVFDRWGDLIYESKEIDMIGWDGRYKKEKLATDVFVYLLRVRCLNGEEYTQKGNVTLLK